jgi:hypothetical protein
MLFLSTSVGSNELVFGSGGGRGEDVSGSGDVLRLRQG